MSLRSRPHSAALVTACLFAAALLSVSAHAYADDAPDGAAPAQAAEQAAAAEPAPSPGAPGAPAPAKDPIVVNGDQVEYFHEKKQVVGTGNISITYKDVILTCDRIVVYLDTRDAAAEGNVKIRQSDAFFTGDKITYNFDTRKGSIDNGYLNAYPMYGRAQSLEKAAMKDEYSMCDGYMTTCDLPNPHYRVRAKQLQIFLDEKIVAKHIIVYLGNVPVMYIPYYAQPLDDRKTHITVLPGQSSDWGYYLLTAYRYYLNDRSRGDVLLDYRTKKGLGAGVNHYLDTEKVGRGAFKFYFDQENNILTADKDKDAPIRDRYRYQYRHRWEMPEVDSYLIAEFNYLSDRDVIKDYFYNEYEEIGDQPDNYISLVTTKRDYSTEFLMRKRFNKFYNVVERLPEYKITINNFKIGDTNFYYKNLTSGAYLNEVFDNTATTAPQGAVSSIRFDTYNQLSYAARLFKAYSVTPYVGMRETYYSRNRWGTTNQLRTVFNAGVDTQVKFYHIYDVESNFLGLDIHKLRHIITPMANYYYTHNPTISVDNLPQFDEIDAVDKANGFVLALENRLQTKRDAGGGVMKSVDLATLIVGTDYAFRLDRENTKFKSSKFKSVDLQLELIPYSWAYLTSKMSINTKKYTIQTGSIDLVMNGGDKWQCVFGTRFENSETCENTLISLDASYRLNKNWKIRAYERWNATKQCFEEMEYTVYRDLHCWVAEFIYNVKDDMENHSVWMVMRLKAFPEYPVGMKQTLSRPRFGAAGEQQ